jgi:hypothetical protein
LQRTEDKSQFTFTADNFPAFFAGNRFCDLQQQLASCYWLIAENGTPLLIQSHYSRKLIPAINRVAASQLPLSDDQLTYKFTSSLQPVLH